MSQDQLQFGYRGPAAFPPNLFEAGQRRGFSIRSAHRLGWNSLCECWLTGDQFPTRFARHEWEGVVDDEIPDSPPVEYTSVWMVLNRAGGWSWWRLVMRFTRDEGTYVSGWRPVPGAPATLASELCPEICGGEVGVKAITDPFYYSRVNEALVNGDHDGLSDLFRPHRRTVSASGDPPLVPFQVGSVRVEC